MQSRLRERAKIIGGIVVILATISWLAVSGIQESKTYYVTVTELQAMGDQAYSRRHRVGGDVAVGSIQRHDERVSFTLIQDKKTLPVVYVGTDPLPDTFRDRAQALADGSYGRDGVFTAKKIQAKCASKYEAKPGGQGTPGTVYEPPRRTAADVPQQREAITKPY